MPASNPLDILLQHDLWATHQIITACEKLPAEQLDRKFDMGPGTLRATITHMIGAINAWTDTLFQRANRPRVEHTGIAYTPQQLREMINESEGELIAVSKLHPLEEIVIRTREGKDYAFTRGAVLTHVTTHGMHHRAQCLNMLKQLGVNPLPPSSVTEWTRFAE